MKFNNSISILLALVLLLVYAGCNTGNLSTAGGSGDKVSLEVKLTPGMVYRQVSKTDQKITETIMGMKTVIHAVNAIYFKNEVLAVDAQGIAEIKCTYERVTMEMDNDMTGKKSYDSDKPDEGGTGLESTGFNGLVGRSITFKMDKRGMVTEVSGVDSLFASILASTGSKADGPAKGMTEKTLKATFGDEGMKSMMQAASIQYPDVLVAEGDTWGKQVESVSAMPMQMETTYKVDHIDADKVVLSYEGTIASDKEKALEFGPISMGVDLSGTTSGTAEISRKTGMILSSTSKNDISGSMTTMSMKLPMKMEQTITVTEY
jgi:Family of unknown function (DUF6263)